MRTITFELRNAYFDEPMGSATIPYDRIKASNGHYSKFWKKWREGIGNLYSIDKHWVRAKITVA